MPKINVYLPDELAAAVREAHIPVSAICQAALERAVRDVESAHGVEEPPTDDRPGLGLLSRFTPRARKSLELAQQAAAGVPHNYVGTEHVLVGLIDEGENLGLRVLASLDIESDDLRAELVASMGPPTAPSTGHIPFTPLSKQALAATAKEALAFGHNYIGCEHMLLGLLAVEEGLASQVMRRMGLELRTTRQAVKTALSGYVHRKQTEPAPPSEDALAQILRRLDAIEKKLA